MRQTNRMIQKTVGIPLEDLVDVENYAEARGISVADAIRMAVVEFLNKYYRNKE